jgi:hypothetical protein
MPISWLEASYVCVPILARIREAKSDVERAMPEIRRFLSENHVSNLRAHECIDAYMRMLGEDAVNFGVIAHGRPSLHDKSIEQVRAEKALLMWVKNLLPKSDDS